MRVEIMLILLAFWSISCLFYAAGQMRCSIRAVPYFYKTIDYFKYETNLNNFGIFCIFTFNLLVSPIYYLFVGIVMFCQKTYNFIYKTTHIIEE